MRQLYFFLVFAFGGCFQSDYTKPKEVSNTHEVDLRSYYAFDKIKKGENVYCYKEERTRKCEYHVYFIPPNDNIMFTTVYNDALRETFEAKQVFTDDYIESNGFGTYDYKGSKRTLTNWNYQDQLPYLISLQDNHFSNILSTNDREENNKISIDYYFTKLIDTAGSSGYPIDNCVKMVMTTESFLNTQNASNDNDIKFKAFEIYAKGIGKIFYTYSIANEAYRLEKIITTKEFEQLRDDHRKRWEELSKRLEQAKKIIDGPFTNDIKKNPK